jgi:hypothetical protein
MFARAPRAEAFLRPKNAVSSELSEFYMGGETTATVGPGVILRGPREKVRKSAAAIYFGREFTYHVRCQRSRSWASSCFAGPRESN